MNVSISVQSEDFDISHEIDALTADTGVAGAVASFVGLVRNKDKSLAAMTLEHYPGMTEKAIGEIVVTAGQRWALYGVRVIHRIGRLLPGDRIVLVVVSSKHRSEAFAACEFIMDYLKTQAPFWKKEETPGGGRWVEARASDDEAASRW
ncbi:MAG: molybdopterin synthase catalytic subunit MoaE [Georgfuchsia sp.]